MEKKKVWYAESDLYQFDIVTRRGRNTIKTDIDRKEAAKRNDIHVGDTIVYKHCMAPRLYVGRVYKITPKATSVVVLGVGDDIFSPPWNKRGDFIEVDQAYMARASTAPQPFPSYYVQSYEVDAVNSNFEDMSVDELRVYVARRIKEADDRLSADIEARKCPACAELAKRYDKPQYAIRRAATETNQLMCMVGPAVQNRYLNSTDTQYHFHVDYSPIGVMDTKTGIPYFEEECVDVEKGALKDLLSPPELHVSSTFVKRLCSDAFDLRPRLDADGKPSEMQKRVDAFVRNRMAAFNATLKETLARFPRGIATFALFRAEYNRLFDKERGEFFLRENRTQDASFLWHRYRGTAQVQKQIKK
jgi:hypothetical protein